MFLFIYLFINQSLTNHKFIMQLTTLTQSFIFARLKQPTQLKSGIQCRFHPNGDKLST